MLPLRYFLVNNKWKLLLLFIIVFFSTTPSVSEVFFPEIDRTSKT